jgi:CCR4-NOT transcription complex subunit 2
MADIEHFDREFPSLSNNSQLPTTGQSSLWSTAGSRNTGGSAQRNQGAAISGSQQNDQSDFFSASSRVAANQGSFRFGSQTGASQPSQAQASTADDFPPLNRNGNGEIGQDRAASLMSTIGFGSQGNIGGGSTQSNRAGNGLLNALSANSRSSEVRSPTFGNIDPVPYRHYRLNADLLQALGPKTAGIHWRKKKPIKSQYLFGKAVLHHKHLCQAQ